MKGEPTPSHALGRAAAPAVAGYLLVRLVGLAVLRAWGAARHQTLAHLLGGKWDAVSYLGIIEHGYDRGSPPLSNLAFFPLYPSIARGLTAVSPLGPTEAAIAVAWIAGAVAAWGLFAVGSRLYGPRAGIVLAMLWGAVPHAVVESMAYSESLFTALSAWTLYLVLAERRLAAGVCCLFAGLARPSAVVLIPVVCLAAALALAQRRGGRDAWAGLLLAPLGWLGYLGWVALRMHRADGWFHVEQAGWGSSWDGGGYTLREARLFLSRELPFDLSLVTLVLALAVMLFLLCVADRQPWPLLLFSGLLLVQTLGGSGYYNAKARFLVAAFPLLLPPAVALARARISTSVIVLGFVTAVSAYLGGYLLLVWSHSP